MNATGNDRSPYLADNGRALYFVRQNDIYASYRNSDGSFGTAFEVPGVNTTEVENDPVVTDDELTIYFKRALASAPDSIADIYRATRSSKTASFDTPLPVSELNTGDNDVPGWISPDDCTLILSAKASGQDQYDLFVSHRPPAP